MLPFVLTVLLETRIASVDLATVAQASPRPRECRGAANGDDGIWSRLRGADAQRYCELLARGYARLNQTPADALSAAEQARKLGGDTPAVRVLSGRAQLRLGQAALAYGELSRAEAADAQAMADPKALHDYARAASLAGQLPEAVRLYRALVSRAALLDDARERTLARLEAAAHLLGRGPAGVDEALGYLAQARQQSYGLAAWLSAVRALALQRAGRSESMPVLPSAAALQLPTVPVFSQDLPLIPANELSELRALLGKAPSPTPRPVSSKR